MLVEEGKIDLDAPVATYIPSFAKTVVYVSGDTLETLKTEPAVRPLTVRDLMRQSAGIPWWGPTKPVERLYAMNGIERAPGEAVPGFKGPRVANLQDLADRVAATPFTNRPGETWTYGIAIDDATLTARAIEWSQTRGARSGRVAIQFVRNLAGEMGSVACDQPASSGIGSTGVAPLR
eukprot:gene10796-14486_t